MPPELTLVIFRVEVQRYAADLHHVERVLPMVAPSIFPKAPEIVMGVFDLHGELIPIIDVRRHLHLPSRPVLPSDQMLVVRTARRRLALVVDDVESVVTIDSAGMTAPHTVVPGLENIRGIVRHADRGIIFVHDMDAFLSLDAETALSAAMSEATTR